MEEKIKSKRVADKVASTGYEEALSRVFDVRLNRKEIYGDSWKNDSFEILKHQILNKIGRFKVLSDVSPILLKKQSQDGTGVYEKTEDTLIDLINYCLFYLQNMIDGDENEK